MLRGAFIGFGNVAENGHAPGWRARDDVADRRGDRRRAVAPRGVPRRLPEGALVDDASDDLLAHETLDFVDICAPPGAHAR